MWDIVLKNFLDTNGINLAELAHKAQAAITTFERLQKDVDFIKNHLIKEGTNDTSSAERITSDTAEPGQ